MKRINNLKKNSYRIKICLKKSQSYSMMFMCQTNNHEKYINLIMLNNRLNNLLFSILFFLKSNVRSEEHTSELQSRFDLVCRLLLEKKKLQNIVTSHTYLSHDRNR